MNFTSEIEAARRGEMQIDGKITTTADERRKMLKKENMKIATKKTLAKTDIETDGGAMITSVVIGKKVNQVNGIGRAVKVIEDDRCLPRVANAYLPTCYLSFQMNKMHLSNLHAPVPNMLKCNIAILVKRQEHFLSYMFFSALVTY